MWLTACPCARAIDRLSRAHRQPTRTLANQNAAAHLRQSGRLSGHHAKCEFYSHSRWTPNVIS